MKKIQIGLLVVIGLCANNKLVAELGAAEARTISRTIATTEARQAEEAAREAQEETLSQQPHERFTRHGTQGVKNRSTPEHFVYHRENPLPAEGGIQQSYEKLKAQGRPRGFAVGGSSTSGEKKVLMTGRTAMAPTTGHEPLAEPSPLGYTRKTGRWSGGELYPENKMIQGISNVAGSTTNRDQGLAGVSKNQDLGRE